MSQQFPSKKMLSQPFTSVENLIPNQLSSIKTPLKTRAISTHMAQKHATYSQPCTTFIFSPMKNQLSNTLNPMDLKRSLHQAISSPKNIIEEREIAYRLQNEKMSQILKEKEIVIYEQKNKIKELENGQEQNKLTLNSLELKINDVLNENQKLNMLLEEKEEAMHLSQHINENLPNLLSENAKLNKIIQDNNKILDNFREENLVLTAKYQEKMRESEVFHDLISKSEALIMENEKLNIFNKNQQKELDIWKNKFLQLEKSVNEFMQNNRKDDSLSKSNHYDQSSSEVLKEKLKATESKLLLLMDENKKLNNFFNIFQREQEEKLIKKQYEIDLLTEKNGDLMRNLEAKQIEIDSFKDIKDKLNLLIQENDKLNKLCNEKIMVSPQKKNPDYQQQMIDLQDKLEIMIEENEKLNAVIEEKNNELENGSNLEEFLAMNEKLNKALREKNQEAEMWKRKFLDSQKS